MSLRRIGSKLFCRNVGFFQVVVINKVSFKALNNLYVALLALFFSAYAGAAESISPSQWLERMSAALQEQNYQGIFIYRRAEDLAAMKVTHVADEHGAREMLETLTGEARSEMRTTPATNTDGVGQLSKIDHYYSLELLGNDRAAGRVTQLISVTPKDEYRYGYRLWLDQATGLLLKSDLLDQNGEILEQVMFTSLELLQPEQIADLIGINKGINNRSAISNSKTIAEPVSPKSSWVVGKLPKGFVLMNAHSNSPNSAFDHSVYSDGLASVSVFIERAKSEGDAFVGVSRMGAVSAFGNVDAGYQITVVGDVPEVTVTTIGQSISLETGSQ